MLIPEIKDRTPNEPGILLSPRQILNIYNDLDDTKTQYSLTQEIIDVVKDNLLEEGLCRVEKTGKQLFVLANVQLKH